MSRPTPVRLGERWLEGLLLAREIEAATLSRGRGIAARGGVGDLVIEPCAVHATVRVRRGTPYRVSVGVARIPTDRWERAAEVIATSPSWCAAVVEGRLGLDLFDELDRAGVELGLDEDNTSVDCTCERPGTMCEHGAAVCARIAGLLDDDPYLVVTLHGGDRSGFVAAVTSATLGSSSGTSVGVEPDGVAARVRDAAGEAESVGIVPAIAARGEPTVVDAASAWRRSVGELPAAPKPRRAPGRPAIAAQAPPAELGVDSVALERLAASAIGRAAALRRALERGDLDAAHQAASLTVGRERDLLRLAVEGELSLDRAASMLGLDPQLLQSVLAGVEAIGQEAFELLGRPRRLGPDEVAELEAVVVGRVRTRSSGALLDDGRQVRRSPSGTWAVVKADGEGRWAIVAAGRDLVEVLDAADVEIVDPDR